MSAMNLGYGIATHQLFVISPPSRLGGWGEYARRRCASGTDQRKRQDTFRAAMLARFARFARFALNGPFHSGNLPTSENAHCYE